MKHLGVGAAVQPHQVTGEGLARIVAEKVLTDGCRQRAAALAAQLRREDGLATACAAIEQEITK